jgi:hypothetical protein
MFLFLFIVATGLTLYDYSIFRAAHGDADRLEAYQHNCWICAFAAKARHEAEEAVASLRGIAIAVDRGNYEAARGDIDRLTAYIGACQDCLFKRAAELELTELHKRANLAAEQARIAELQREQQLPAPPQKNEPPHHVTCRMTNSSGVSIATQFFSLSRIGLSWPGSKSPLIAGQTEDYDLACESYEKICYGAWMVSQKEFGHWGVGPLGTDRCTDCCMTCDGTLHVFTLLVANE